MKPKPKKTKATGAKATDTRARKRQTIGVRHSEEIADQICYRMATGESLKSICRLPGMPTFQSVLRWVNDKPDFAKSYAIACDMRAQSIADDIIEISDQSPGKCHGEPGTGEASARLMAEKLRVDARKWLLARLSPKRYGDRLMSEISGPDGGPVELGSSRPSAEDVSAFSRELHQGFFNYRDPKTTEAATLDAEQAGALAEAVALFAAGRAETTSGRSPGETGAMLAKITFARRRIQAEQAKP